MRHCETFVNGNRMCDPIPWVQNHPSRTTCCVSVMLKRNKISFRGQSWAMSTSVRLEAQRAALSFATLHAIHHAMKVWNRGFPFAYLSVCRMQCKAKKVVHSFIHSIIHSILVDTHKLKTACIDKNKAGTLKVSKNTSAAFSLFLLGFNGASVKRTGCSSENVDSWSCKKEIKYK